MARETIDFGIDLGTTTSAIAQATANDAKVIRNNLQAEYTPSAVYVSRSNKILVGAAAKSRVESDPGNACAEFKLQMGVRGEHKRFEASGRSMTPEELSAEVLKSLRGDVREYSGEDIGAAVITVPAAFELDQCDATRQAAALAGLSFAPLIQEPSAAAWAYSVHSSTNRGFWLIYDFGGGTFDAAIVRVADGEFSTVMHAGDNFLGGKLIDWALVENALIPAIRREYNLTNIVRGDPKSAGNVGRLKAAAENAKIQLSRVEATDVDLELTDDAGNRIELICQITRADVERAGLPLFRRSIKLCRKALADANLGAADIERVILVGGTTIMPPARQLLADPNEGLGIPLDHSIDPVTVVARGAAIFSGTQRLPQRPQMVAESLGMGKVVPELKHQPAGTETEPLVGGTLRTAEPRDWTGGTIEFVNSAAQPEWRSGQIPLTAAGTFSGRLRAEEQTSNTYRIELRDDKGNLVETEPNHTTYQHRSSMGTAPTLSHSVGVGLANNEVGWLLRKGAELPATKRLILRSTVDVHRGTGSGFIRVPIVQGELSRADRNSVVGQLDIEPNGVKRDVPAGSEVEVTIRIDTSFAVRADAYVPILDEEFLIEVDLSRSGAVDVAELRKAADDLAQRFAELSERAHRLGSGTESATELIEQLRQDGVIGEIQQLATKAEVDADAAQTCQRKLREAHTTLDEIEAALVFPELVDEARAALAATREMMTNGGNPAYQTALNNAERAINSAIAAGDRTVLQRQIGVVREIGVEMLRDSGQLDAVIFGAREERLSANPDQRVQRLLQEGRSALARGDATRLGSINEQLRKLAPPSFGDPDDTDPFSTVTDGQR